MRAYAGPGLDNVALWHERDISHSSVERVALADSTTLVDFMLRRATGLVRGLVVHEDRIRRNLDSSRGLVFSEGLLLALVDAGTPRQEAYGWVQKAAMRVWDEGIPFAEAARASADITGRLSHEAIDELFDPAHALRHAASIIARALGEDED